MARRRPSLIAPLSSGVRTFEQRLHSPPRRVAAVASLPQCGELALAALTANARFAACRRLPAPNACDVLSAASARAAPSRGGKLGELSCRERDELKRNGADVAAHASLHTTRAESVLTSAVRTRARARARAHAHVATRSVVRCSARERLAIPFDTRFGPMRRRWTCHNTVGTAKYRSRRHESRPYRKCTSLAIWLEAPTCERAVGALSVRLLFGAFTQKAIRPTDILISLPLAQAT